jgi:hypothetical protein
VQQYWAVVPSAGFSIRHAAKSSVREFDLIVTLGGKGELYVRVPIAE